MRRGWLDICNYRPKPAFFIGFCQVWGNYRARSKEKPAFFRGFCAHVLAPIPRYSPKPSFSIGFYEVLVTIGANLPGNGTESEDFDHLDCQQDVTWRCHASVGYKQDVTCKCHPSVCGSFAIIFSSHLISSHLFSPLLSSPLLLSGLKPS